TRFSRDWSSDVCSSDLVDTPSGAPDLPDTKSDDPETTDPDDPTVVTVPQRPAFTLVKTAGAITDTNGDGRHSAGDQISYTFTLTNTGNVTITAPTLTDAKLGMASVSFPETPLVPGASTTLTWTLQITQDDMVIGDVSISASYTDKAHNGDEVSDVSDTGTVRDGSSITYPEEFDSECNGDDGNDPTVLDLDQLPALTFTKSDALTNDADGNGEVSEGDVLTYTFTVANTGNVTLGNVSITDTDLPGLSALTYTWPNESAPGVPVVGEVRPGQSVTATATYTVTLADVNRGHITNQATVSVDTPSGAPDLPDTKSDDPETTDLDDPTVVTVPQRPGIALVKTAGAITDTNGDGRHSAGDQISYTFTLTNTGNVTITAPTLTDAKLGMASVSFPDTSLVPGASTTLTRPYTLTQA